MYDDRKKYRKLRYQFDGVIKRSDDLFKQDLIATAAIKRITEENKYGSSFTLLSVSQWT